jgi:nicotinamide-nucleotide amidase
MIPRIELLNTGSELLLGNVRDLHLSWLGKGLFPLGLRISRQVTVPDGAMIRDALVEAFPRTEMLIVTGGLGPTTDDMTRELVAELLGRRLLLQQEILDNIQERCRQRGFTFHSRMERQAMVPEGAIVLPNEHGSAPGLYIPACEGVSSVRPHLFLLPGPPRELQPMARSFLFPLLKNLMFSPQRVDCRIYKIVGMGESMVEALVGLKLSQRGDLEVGYCARPNEVDFRLIGSREVLEKVEPLVLAAVGEYLVSDQGEGMEEVVVHLLKKAQATLATAESCTGGFLASCLTDVPGASEVFLEGFVTYSNQAKSDLLDVPAALISLHGAVSEEVACAMADGARARSGASHALATTGIAGPGGGSLEKPVGTVWIALSSEGKKTEAWREYFPVDRTSFKQVVAQSALDHLRKLLQKPSVKSGSKTF